MDAWFPVLFKALSSLITIIYFYIQIIADLVSGSPFMFASMCFFPCSHLSLSIFLHSVTKCFRFTLCLTNLSLRINLFSKKSRFFLVENGI